MSQLSLPLFSSLLCLQICTCSKSVKSANTTKEIHENSSLDSEDEDFSRRLFEFKPADPSPWELIDSITIFKAVNVEPKFVDYFSSRWVLQKRLSEHDAWNLCIELRSSIRCWVPPKAGALPQLGERAGRYMSLEKGLAYRTERWRCEIFLKNKRVARIYFQEACGSSGQVYFLTEYGSGPNSINDFIIGPIPPSVRQFLVK